MVYDLGAGNGSFPLAMQKYAKKVVAVELDPALASDCRFRGIETIEDNFVNVSLDGAEVIYLFLNLMGNYAITKKIQEDNWHGTIISHFYPLMNDITDFIKPDEVIDVNIYGFRAPFLIYKI